MHKIRIAIVMSFLIVVGICLCFHIGCENATEDDMKRLNVLEKTYGDKFHFKLENEFYLRVSVKKELEVDEKELIEIYKLFFFDELGGQRRKTSFVYLNYYDSTGKFRFQIAYDSNKNEFTKSKTEHY